MKFKMKTTLLIGSCLLLSASQLQAAKPIVKFECDAATQRNARAYRIELTNLRTASSRELLCTDSQPPRLIEHEVSAGEYAISGYVVSLYHGRYKCNHLNKILLKENETYILSVSTESGCEISISH